MTEPRWTPVVKDKLLNAPVDTLWAKVIDYVRGPRKLKIEAEGNWQYDLGKQCGPDGKPTEGFSDDNLHKAALRGCLIAKIGGCAGDTPGSEKIFAVGSFSIFETGDVSGSLFVSINDDPKSFNKHSSKLKITVSEAP